MKMKTLYSITLVLLVLLSLVSLPAKAALLQGTDPRFGPNSLTIDTSTQLAWLNLGNSLGLSYNQALADTAPGGIFSGYRFATVNEVLGLYASAGIPGTGYYPLDYGPIQSLISLVGPTGVIDGWPEISGITGSNFGSPGQQILDTSQIYVFGGNPAYYYLVSGNGFYDFQLGPDTSFPGYGNWLVKVVPEPNACLLMAGGLIGFALLKRRDKDQ